MAKKSMHKGKRCAKGAQKTTALEAFLQTLTKAKEEAIAPQRKKARNATHQTKAETGSVSGDSQVLGQHRSDMEEEDTAVAPPPAAYATYELPPDWDQWNMKRKNMYKQRQRDKQRKAWGGAPGSLG